MRLKRRVGCVTEHGSLQAAWSCLNSAASMKGSPSSDFGIFSPLSRMVHCTGAAKPSTADRCIDVAS
jgi:hypothetical protein